MEEQTALVDRQKRAIDLSFLLQSEMQRSMPFLIMGMDRMLTETNNPDASDIRKEAEHTLASTLIVYLFSAWDEHVALDDTKAYLRADEEERFLAYKHIRVVAAHNIRGARKDTRGKKPRMGFDSEFDNVMASSHPLGGVAYNADYLNLSLPDSVLDCLQFMQDLAQRLPARFAAGVNGTVRDQNGVEHDVL